MNLRSAVFSTSTATVQLFRERGSFKREKAYATISKVILGNGGFYGCLIEPQGVSARLKVTAQTRVFQLSRSVLLNHLEPQSSKTKLLLAIMPIDIVAYAFTLFWDNICRNSCIPHRRFAQNISIIGDIFIIFFQSRKATRE